MVKPYKSYYKKRNSNKCIQLSKDRISTKNTNYINLPCLVSSQSLIFIYFSTTTFYKLKN